MSRTYTCVCIDDDPLLLRKLEAYIEEIDWLTLLETHNNPVQGATAVIAAKPDIILLDIEMPMVDGNYLVDWVGPKLELLDPAPKVIIVSSLHVPQNEQLPQVAGYINKAQVTSPEALEEKLKELLHSG